MHIPRPRPGPPRSLRLPRRTARLRLTVLYGVAVLACGAVAIALIYAYLFYVNTPRKLALSVELPKTSGQYDVVLRAPAAAVTQAGPYDLFKVPRTAVRQVGSYDELRSPVQQPKQAPVTPAAQRKKFVSEIYARVDYDKRQLLVACASGLAVIAMAAAAIGWLLAGRVLRPLSTITAAARRISASSLHERLALQGPDDELKELANTLDGLFARLEASFDAQQRFAANASHELRTPLTRERTLLQVTLADPASTTGTWQAVGRELLASNAETERLIESLLTLASSEADTGEREPVDLAAIASAALAAARPAISRIGLNVHADIQPASVDGDPLLIQQLAANLIGNAVRHNIPGGDVQVATGTSGGHAVLSVTNSGQAIPPAEVDRLFQPFQRLGPRRARRDGGHGLGLSIVRAIVTAHAATIGARALPGGGLAVDVTFPPASPLAGAAQRAEY
jgi:signal transduction histidine kinase